MNYMSYKKMSGVGFIHQLLWQRSVVMVRIQIIINRCLLLLHLTEVLWQEKFLEGELENFYNRELKCLGKGYMKRKDGILLNPFASKITPTLNDICPIFWNSRKYHYVLYGPLSSKTIPLEMNPKQVPQKVRVCACFLCLFSWSNMDLWDSPGRETHNFFRQSVSQVPWAGIYWVHVMWQVLF